MQQRLAGYKLKRLPNGETMKKIIQTPAGLQEIPMTNDEIQKSSQDGSLEARIERLENIAASKGWVIQI